MKRDLLIWLHIVGMAVALAVIWAAGIAVLTR